MQADAVLAGAGAAQAQRAADQLRAERLGQHALLGLRRVDQVADVEVAVADMADEEIGQAGGVGLGDRFADGLGQARDRHAGVGGDAAAARAGLQRGEVGMVARGPQPGALLRRGRPLEGLAAQLGRDVLHRARLFGHTGGRAVELHQQHRLLPQAQAVVAVDRRHRAAVEQLAARDRHAHLDDRDRGLHRRVDRGEMADGCRHRLGQRVELQRDLGHHAQRALAADEQARQVVAGAGLARARAGAHPFAAGADHAQCQHVLAHGAVAHRVGA